MAYYSIDVECVATAKTHNARAVAQISLVDQFENVLLNLYVKPELPVVSYLTPLTGYGRSVVQFRASVAVSFSPHLSPSAGPRHTGLVAVAWSLLLTFH